MFVGEFARRRDDQYRLFCHIANEHIKVLESLYISKKHQIPSRSLKESFTGNSVKISDCRAFSPFKTLPGCGAFSHSLIFFCIIFFGQEGHRPHSRDRRSSNAYAWMYIMQLPIAHLKNCEPNRYNVHWRILPSATSF